MPSKQRFNPFPGLRPFGIEEDYLFFGREEQVTELLGLLREHRFLAVVGTSGSGKSSLVRAGLLPALHGGTLTAAGSNWEVLLFRPGGDPITNLASNLLNADLYDSEDDESLPRVKATLTRSRMGLVEAVKQSDLPPDTNLLVVVDQFEELFRYRDSGVSGQEGAAAFVKLLLAACAQQEQPIYVTITMRSDYLGDCAQIPGLAEAVNDGEYLIPRLSRKQRRAAIEKPVHVGGGEIAQPLVHKLLNEVGDDADQLPVLQHALMRIWDHWAADGKTDQPISLGHYEQVGGLAEALSQHADEVYAELPDDRHRLIAQKVFQAITERGSDNRGIRRPTRFDQLCEIVNGAPEELTLVIDAFRRAGRTFLMPPEGVELNPQTIIDISHESLMRVWRQLREWVEQESQSARIYRRLADTAALHQEGKAGLYHDPDLQIASSWREATNPSEAWAARYHSGFAQAISFLDASREAEVEAEEQREAARKREIEVARKLAQAERERAETVSQSARRLRGMVGGLALVAALAAVASVVAFNSWRVADNAKREAQLSEQSAKLSEASARRNEQFAQDEAARATASESMAVEAQLALKSKKYSSDMTLAQHSYIDGNIGALSEHLLEHVPESGNRDPRGIEWYLWWNASHLESRVVNRTGAHIFSLAISPDGRFAADGSWNHKVRLRELSNSTNLHEFNNGDNQKRWLGFTPDSSLLLTVGGPRINRFSTEDAKPLGSVSAPVNLRGLAISPDGNVVVSGGDAGRLFFWDTVSWQRTEATSTPNLLPIWSLAYAPQGDRLAIGTDGGRDSDRATLDADSPLVLWNTTTQSVEKSAAGHTARITSVAWSPDGEYLASGSADTSVRVWKKDLSPVASLDSLAWVSQVAFSPDGEYLAAGTGKDNAVRVWSTDRWELVATLKGHSRPVTGIAFDPRSGELWSASEDSMIKIWNIDRQRRNSITLGGESLRAMLTGADESAVASDGRTLFSGGDNQPIQRYDLENRIAMPAWSGGQSFRRTKFSDDGAVIAAVDSEDLLRVWRTDSEEAIAEVQMPAEDASSLHSIAVSPDASVVAWAARSPLHVMAVDTASGTRIEVPTGMNPSDWRFLVISPGATHLCLKSGFGLSLLDISGLKLGQTEGAGVRQLPDSALLNSYTFSPDGKLGAGPTFHSVIQLHDIESGRTLRTLTGHSSQVRHCAFSEDGSRLLSCSDDGTVRIWNVETGESLTTLPAHRGPVDWVGFGANEGQILSLSRAERTVRIWGAMSPQDLAQSETYWRELALYGEQTGRSEQAARAYDQAIRLSPGDAKLLLARAELNSKLARTNAATGDYIKVIALGDADSTTVETAKSFATRTPLLPDSSEHPRSWRYTFERPGTGWTEPGFDDSSWKPGESPFGSDASDNTWWGGPDIWLRLEFELADPITKPLFIDAHIDDIAEFYVNGIYAGNGRWTGSGMQQLYQRINCSDEVVAALKPGRNFLAIHCHDTGGGGAGIDAKLFLDEGEQGWIDRLTEAIDKDPTNVHLLRTRSQAHAARGDTELAAADAAMLLQWLSDAVAAELNDPEIVWARSAGPLADLLLKTYQEESDSWQVLDVVEMESAGGATLTKLDDGSILASGKNPDSDAYTIIGETDASPIAALRIEALTDPSLPRSGPGRDNTNDLGNFSINKLTVSSDNGAQGEAASEVVFGQAWADHANHPQERLLEGHWNTGGGGGKPHQALFLLQRPVGGDEGARLEFQMQFQTSPRWPGQNLGRFRLSVAADASSWRNSILASRWQDLPTSDWTRLAAAYFLVGDTQALNHLLEHKPQAASGIGDLYASAEEWERAVAAYDKQVSPETTDANLLVKRGEAYARLTQWDAAKSDWQRAAKLRPGILQEPFDRLRMAEQWQAAAIVGVLLIEQDPGNRFLWLRTAPAFVLAGDDQGYRQLCESMLDQFAGTTALEDAESVCKVCTLMVGTVDVSRLPVKLFADALDQKTAPEWFFPWAWAARALVAHRSGDREQASECVQQAFKNSTSPTTRALSYSIAALERLERGDVAGAREALGHATKLIEQDSPGTTANELHDWLMPLILVREAENLLADEQN